MKVRELVEREVGRRWAEFEAKHPALAEELGREDYVVAAMDRLRGEPAYREVMGNAQVTATAAEAVVSLVEKIVTTVMRI